MLTSWFHPTSVIHPCISGRGPTAYNKGVLCARRNPWETVLLTKAVFWAQSLSSRAACSFQGVKAEQFDGVFSADRAVQKWLILGGFYRKDSFSLSKGKKYHSSPKCRWKTNKYTHTTHQRKLQPFIWFQIQVSCIDIQHPTFPAVWCFCTVKH